MEKKEHIKYRGQSKFGKTTCNIKCPFCETITTAYVWSLAGSGKKCSGCGAMHTSFGLTLKKHS